MGVAFFYWRQFGCGLCYAAGAPPYAPPLPLPTPVLHSPCLIKIKVAKQITPQQLKKSRRKKETKKPPEDSNNNEEEEEESKVHAQKIQIYIEKNVKQSKAKVAIKWKQMNCLFNAPLGVASSPAGGKPCVRWPKHAERLI